MKIEIHYIINVRDEYLDACFAVKREQYAEMFAADVEITAPSVDTRVLTFDTSRPMSAFDLVVAEEASAILADSQHPDNHIDVEITYVTADDADISDQLQ